MLQLATDNKVPIGHTFVNSSKSQFLLLIKEESGFGTGLSDPLAVLKHPLLSFKLVTEGLNAG